ncbi:MAG: glycosyltransferase family 2 protein [Candidatus Omnitrophica bacterium]|jgi:glycosyltransferase involved in cell wall biosynthesis|nr:glycosyltransferase family 2 protein [Candidatus Omnitrophota bacterium]
MIEYSVILPVYNEEESLNKLCSSLEEVMSKLSKPYEIIFIDDGSQDKSLEILRSLQSKSRNVLLIDLGKHLGQARAMQAGFDAARGDIIITIDSDGQFDPQDIPKLLDKLNQGFDVVCGFRDKRRDAFSKIASAKIANIIRRIFIGERIHDVGSTFRAYRSKTVKNLSLTKDKLLLMTAILLKKGYRIGEVKVRHYPRATGQSKYNVKNRFFSGLIGIIKLDKYKKQ